jgi:hypothetical protein
VASDTAAPAGSRRPRHLATGWITAPAPRRRADDRSSFLSAPCQSECFDEVVNMRPSEVQAPSRLRDVPIALPERFADELRLEASGLLMERRRKIVGRHTRWLAEQMPCFELHGAFTCRANRGCPDRIRELPHVARPPRCLCGVERHRATGRDTGGGAAYRLHRRRTRRDRECPPTSRTYIRCRVWPSRHTPGSDVGRSNRYLVLEDNRAANVAPPFPARRHSPTYRRRGTWEDKTHKGVSARSPTERVYTPRAFQQSTGVAPYGGRRARRVGVCVGRGRAAGRPVRVIGAAERRHEGPLLN